MSYPLLALQQAVYAALSGDATLQNMVNGIYDQPPADAVHPFIAIESVSAQDWPMQGVLGVRAEMQLAVYSRYHGKSESHSIAARIYALLHQAALTAAPYTVAQCRVRASDAALLSDQRTNRVALRVQLDAHA